MSTQPARRHARQELEIPPEARRRILYFLRETDWGVRRIAKRFKVQIVTVQRIRDEAKLVRN